MFAVGVRTVGLRQAIIVIIVILCLYSYLSTMLLLEGGSYRHALATWDEGGSLALIPVDEKLTKRPKIAVMSSFVPNQDVGPPPRLKQDYFNHTISKACYCYIWGYDFIFNTTYGFDDTYPKWNWLGYGTWHRVPHLESRIRDYDWILYTDTDFAIKDMISPLESFLREFELYGKDNVQLFIPQDNYGDGKFRFSAFAFMIRNSPFGRTVLKYWDEFARGLCERGNLNLTANHPYNWLYSDQPGLWYAMMRTYADFFPDRVPENNYPQCNGAIGVLDSHVPPWNDFFKAMPNLTKGSTGEELARVPDDQPFIWSSLPKGRRSGLALQLNWGIEPSLRQKYIDGAFALHLKKVQDFPKDLLDEISHCRENLGCYAHYDELGDLKIGCGDKVYL